MAGLSYLTYYLLNANFNAADFSRTINGLIVLAAITVGVISYGVMAKLAGLDYAERIMQGIANRFNKKK
jgi:alkylated DNA nucleotide flippase Atl1